MPDIAEPMGHPVYDKNRYPIYPGDVLRTFHFRGSRRRKYYLYHVAVMRDGYLSAVPASILGKDAEGGNFWILDSTAVVLEIVQGYGPDEGMLFTDRPRAALKARTEG